MPLYEKASNINELAKKKKKKKNHKAPLNAFTKTSSDGLYPRVLKELVGFPLHFKIIVIITVFTFKIFGEWVRHKKSKAGENRTWFSKGKCKELHT